MYHLISVKMGFKTSGKPIILCTLPHLRIFSNVSLKLLSCAFKAELSVTAFIYASLLQWTDSRYILGVVHIDIRCFKLLNIPNLL